MFAVMRFGTNIYYTEMMCRVCETDTPFQGQDLTLAREVMSLHFLYPSSLCNSGRFRHMKFCAFFCEYFSFSSLFNIEEIYNGDNI